MFIVFLILAISTGIAWAITGWTWCGIVSLVLIAMDIAILLAKLGILGETISELIDILFCFDDDFTDDF